MAIPFSISSKDSVLSIKEAINKDGSVVFISTRMPRFGKQDSVYKRGVLAQIKKITELSDTTARIDVVTFGKGDILSYTQQSPFFRVDVSTLPLIDSAAEEYEELLEEVRNKISPFLTNEISERLENPYEFINVLSNIFEIPIEVLQKMLEQDTDVLTLKVLSEVLDYRKSKVGGPTVIFQDGRIPNELQQAMMSERAKEKAAEKMDELEELHKKIKNIKFPDHVKKELDKQFHRLARLNPEMSEYYTTRNYIDWLVDVPWGKESPSDFDLKKLSEELDKSHYGLKDVKDRILEYLAVQKLKGENRGSIMCLISPPGCGKTSIAKSIASALGRKFVKISLGGVRDEAEIRGHRRTYVGSMPGKIIQALKQADTMNPVILLDEIDKLGNDHYRGSPSSALLEALDAEQNRDFLDHFINLGVDLSKILFIATGNDVENIERALYDRLEVMNLDGYSENEKIYIANEYLISSVSEETAVSDSLVSFSEGAIQSIISQYTRESGVRALRRKIETIFRKIAKEIAMGEMPKKVEITQKNLSKYLGPQTIYNDKVSTRDVSGIVFGLAWNGQGGDLLPIEAVTHAEGEGEVETTGSLGKVMEESIKVGLAYLRSSSKTFNINPEFFKKNDFHVHFPEGAVPKDGPSAGCAITMALLSKILNVIVPKDIAMTGEITINGSVLAIGGVKEKVMAAKRNGVTRLFFPKSNQKDVEKLDSRDVKGITFTYVATFEELWNNIGVGSEKPRELVV
jgi:ATP-dependent Lon protease